MVKFNDDCFRNILSGMATQMKNHPSFENNTLVPQRMWIKCGVFVIKTNSPYTSIGLVLLLSCITLLLFDQCFKTLPPDCEKFGKSDSFFKLASRPPVCPCQLAGLNHS